MEDILLGNDLEDRLKNLEKRRIFKADGCHQGIICTRYFQGSLAEFEPACVLLSTNATRDPH